MNTVPQELVRAEGMESTHVLKWKKTVQNRKGLDRRYRLEKARGKIVLKVKRKAVMPFFSLYDR